ncbi:hypothetical protein Tco_1561983 [Tanacetum coccineum]
MEMETVHWLQGASEECTQGRAKVEEDDREWDCFLGGKISLGRKKSWESNIGDSGNTGDGGKTVGGAIGARGSRIDGLIDSQQLGEVFPSEAGKYSSEAGV